MHRFWCVSALALFLVLSLGSGAAGEERGMRFGLGGGWMLGSGPPYGHYWFGHLDYHYRLDFNVVGYFELDLLRRLALQFEASYQGGSSDTDFVYGDLTSEERGRFGVFSMALGLVYTEPIVRGLAYFIKIAGGLSWGDWGEFSGTYYNWNFGGGLKFYVHKPPAHDAIVLSVVWQNLLKPHDYYTSSAEAFKFNLGFEF